MKPFILADYPYYRDNPEMWKRKLLKLLSLGVDTVTFYIPWRHHLLNNKKYCFNSESDVQNRDVIGFLNIIADIGLHAIVKPGPFIHAEVAFGGLPDCCSPTYRNNIEAFRDQNGSPVLYEGLELPFPFDPVFKDMTKVWIDNVNKNVILPYSHPNGPIIGIQLGNEGIFSDIHKDADLYDYEKVLKAIGDTCPYLIYQSFFMFLRELMPANIEYYVNLPAANVSMNKDIRYTHWLSRVVPEEFLRINYGWTHWYDTITENRDSLKSAILACKRYDGINLEYNGGFVWDSPIYKEASNFIFHAAFFLAAGSRGVCVYPGVATDSWGETIQVSDDWLRENPDRIRYYAGPYGAECPITVDGNTTEKYFHLKKFFFYINYLSINNFRNIPSSVIVIPKDIYKSHYYNSHAFNNWLDASIEYHIRAGKDFDLLIGDKTSFSEYESVFFYEEELSNPSVFDNEINREYYFFIKQNVNNANDYLIFVFSYDARISIEDILFEMPILINMPPYSVMIMNIFNNELISVYYNSKAASEAYLRYEKREIKINSESFISIY